LNLRSCPIGTTPLPLWRGKLVVLCLLGFLATDFVITITLSAADATAHIVENPWAPAALQHRVGLTLLLIAILGAFFIRGFHEAIGLAVVLVAVYLVVNVVVILVGLSAVLRHGAVIHDWGQALLHAFLRQAHVPTPDIERAWRALGSRQPRSRRSGSRQERPAASDPEHVQLFQMRTLPELGTAIATPR
jgi:hypothetical protein